jgi:hypothetical protein
MSIARRSRVVEATKVRKPAGAVTRVVIAYPERL